MDRGKKIDLVNRVLHATVNSVVQYIDIATPYVPPGYEEQRAEVQRMRDEEVRTATELTDLVNALDGTPTVGVFPYWNIDLNYLDLRFLARFAAEHQEKAVAELEQELPKLRDDPKLHGTMARILGEKRGHLETLREIGKPPPEPEKAEEPEAEAASE